MPRAEVKRQSMIHTRPQTNVVPVPNNPISTSPTFGQIVKEGVGFGAGSAIGHRIVGAFLGPSMTTSVSQTTPTESTQSSQKKCVPERNAFELCLKTKGQEDVCNNEFNAYTQCIQLN